MAKIISFLVLCMIAIPSLASTVKDKDLGDTKIELKDVDANQDGVLSSQEAKDYIKKLQTEFAQELERQKQVEKSTDDVVPSVENIGPFPEQPKAETNPILADIDNQNNKPNGEESKDKNIPPTVQKKYDRRLEEMKTLDKNQDGILQAEELQSSVQSKFDSADTNKDGVVSPEETRATIDSFKKSGQDIYGDMTDRRAKSLENRYNNADANKDDQVSKEEYDSYFGGRYQKYDRDDDGIVTEKEYRTDVEKLPRSYNRKK